MAFSLLVLYRICFEPKLSPSFEKRYWYFILEKQENSLMLVSIDVTKNVLSDENFSVKFCLIIGDIIWMHQIFRFIVNFDRLLFNP